MSEQVASMIDTVERINNFLYEKLTENFYLEYPFFVSYSSSGYAEAIEFLGISIWDSENDEREELPNGKYEDLEPYLRKKIDFIITNLSKIIQKEDK